MITRILKRGQIFAFIPFFEPEENPHDVIDPDKKLALNPGDTGFERLKNLFRPRYDDVFDPRVTSIIHTVFGTFVIAGIYGGIQSSRTAFISFIENNEATRFRNHYEAKRQLSDTMFTSFVRGGTKWGLKVSFFCTSFMVAYTAISVYRDKDSVLYYTAAGSFAGAMYKFPLGPKGMVSGGFFGSLFGTVYGGFKYLMFYLTKLTEEQLREQKKEYKIVREEAIRNTHKEFQNKEAKEELLQLMSKPK